MSRMKPKYHYPMHILFRIERLETCELHGYLVVRCDVTKGAETMVERAAEIEARRYYRPDVYDLRLDYNAAPSLVMDYTYSRNLNVVCSLPPGEADLDVNLPY